MAQYILGGLLGLAFGAFVSWCSARLIRHSLQNPKIAAVLGANLLRQLLDIMALLIVFLLRRVLPFPFYAVIIGTAVGLSIGGVLLALRTGRQLKQPEEEKTEEL